MLEPADVVDADDVIALPLHCSARLTQKQLRCLGIGERPGKRSEGRRFASGELRPVAHGVD
ncbi:hypothetical protein [Sorangium cellulosum]|nr:hypothetical protein [Sorangium cellulosum]